MRTRILPLTLVLGSALLIALSIAGAAALAPTAQGQSPNASFTAEYLIGLAVPPAQSLSAPDGMTPEQAGEYARELTHRQAEPILKQLQALQAEGKIAGFQVRPDLHAVAVQVKVAPDAPAALKHLSGLGYTTQATEPPVCLAAAAAALAQQAAGLSQPPPARPSYPAAGVLGAQATNPSIVAYVRPGDSWTYFSGATAPRVNVAARILRGRQVIFADSTTSDGGGYYSFYPDWQECPNYGYNWVLQPGDTVEVTADGNTVSTIIAPVSAWVDPTTNVVAGQTEAARTVEVWVTQYQTNLCQTVSYSRTATVGADGSFSADLTGKVDFDRSAWANVYAYDANGNATRANFYAYRIGAYFDASQVFGYLKPGVNFTASLRRGGNVISVKEGKSSAYGYYSGSFTTTIQAGDVIQVSGGGVSMQLTAAKLDASLDRAADKASGVTAANQRVKISFYKARYSYYLRTTCASSAYASCASAMADGSGAFSANSTLDLVRGDYAYFYVYDAEGNYQYTDQRPVPAIIAGRGQSEIKGYWSDPATEYVTVTLKDNGGAVKGADADVWVSSWDGSFSTWLGAIVSPTDRIEVTDGAVTETMTVQNLTARLDGGSGHLAGSAHNDHLLAYLYDFQREFGYSWGMCAETSVAGGAYDLTFADAQVGAQDDADVWNTGPDGHYTFQNPHAFSVSAQKEGAAIEGYSETPRVPVTVTLKNGATVKAVYTDTTSNSGYYSGDLTGAIQAGDTLEVQTGDGDSVSLNIPDVTMIQDAAQNRVHGQAPAGEPVEIELRRWYKQYGYESYTRVSSIATSDNAGNYSASFDGLYWARWSGGTVCAPTQAGHRCAQAVLDYYNAAEHHIWQEGPQPAPVGADAYENDDQALDASLYAGIQHHSFHAVTDTDWISFTVPAHAADNHVTYHIQTFDLGWGMETRVRLYGSATAVIPLFDQTASDTQGGVLVDWTPEAAGTYYLHIAPASSDRTAYCDAVYSLRIFYTRSRLYLPIILSNR